jgi:hypothetical protein
MCASRNKALFLFQAIPMLTPVITGTCLSRSIARVPSLDPSSATTMAAFGWRVKVRT